MIENLLKDLNEILNKEHNENNLHKAICITNQLRYKIEEKLYTQIPNKKRLEMCIDSEKDIHKYIFKHFINNISEEQASDINNLYSCKINDMNDYSYIICLNNKYAIEKLQPCYIHSIVDVKDNVILNSNCCNLNQKGIEMANNFVNTLLKNYKKYERNI